jgi:ferrous-iron efflux pump FieF
MAVSPTLSPEVLAQQMMMRKATRASLAVALGLIVLKAAAWWWTDAVSLLASLLDSTTDALASGVTLVAVHASLQPADEEHRFGHGKLEPLAGLAQSMLVLGSAIWLAVSAVQRLRNPQPVQLGGIGIAVMIAASAATLLLVRYQRKVSAATRSTAVNADRLHYESDLLMNAVVIVSLLATTWLGWQMIDPLLGLCVAVLVARSAWQIAWDSVQLLMDREFPDAERQALVEAVLAHPEVHGIHDLRTRRSGTLAFVQFHVELDGDMSLRAAHDVTDAIERALRDAYPHAEILIHVDPKGHPTEGPSINRESGLTAASPVKP